MITAMEIATRLDLRRSSHSWRGDCPACGYRGSFALKEGRTGRPLIFCSNGCDRAALTAAVEGIVGGGVAAAPIVPEKPKANRQDAARRLWGSAYGLDRSLSRTAVTYLNVRRIGHLVKSAALRFSPEVHHPEGGKLAALVALVVDAAGAPIAAHRTFLRADGMGKAAVTPPKASLGPVWGGAVRLQPATNGAVIIGEGIETSASAGILLGLPAWAAISAGNLAAGLLLPSDIGSVTIAADNDPPGLRAAETAAARWRADGRTVRILVPATAADFNDELRAQESNHG